jgi:hypothetical protein
MGARDTELDSFVTAFVQNSLSQAKQMVGEVMQVCSSPAGILNFCAIKGIIVFQLNSQYAADVLFHRHHIAWNLKLLLVMANLHPA